MNKKLYHTPYTECMELVGCQMMQTTEPSRNANPVETPIGGGAPTPAGMIGRKVF